MIRQVEQIIGGFEPISLQQMDSVKLQDRIDTKFMFPASLLPEILIQLRDHYYVLEVAGKRYTHYETLYFDTDGFEMYLRHHNGKLNRYKFRSRRYVESDLHFFEIKFKNNKGRTIKDRISNREIVHELKGQPGELVKAHAGIDPCLLHAKLWVNYIRITMVSKTTRERLTIDLNLNFKDDRKDITYSDLVIAEVKMAGARDKSVFSSLMKRFAIETKSISKYCLGVVTLHPEIKKNNFKPTLLYLHKLLKAS